jgi:hypothetical protein
LARFHSNSGSLADFLSSSPILACFHSNSGGQQLNSKLLFVSG